MNRNIRERSLFDSPNFNSTMKERIKNGNVPDTWSIITALDWILADAKDSALEKEFWEDCEAPINFLTQQLGLSKAQVVFLAVMVEAGEPLSWKRFGNFFGTSRLSIMVYSDELEDLVAKGWVEKKVVRDMGTNYEGFALERGVVTALRHNTPFVPAKIEGLTEQELVDIIKCRLNRNHEPRVSFCDEEERFVRMCKANPQLPLCQEVMKLENIHDKSLLLMIVCDYAEYGETNREGLSMRDIEMYYIGEINYFEMANGLRKGSHILMEKGFIENKCEDGIADPETFVLTQKSKTELLSDYNIYRSKKSKSNKYMMSHTTIKEKELFYNQAEGEQVERLISLLDQENLTSVQNRLEEQGMRKGFACIFHGGPGTGKTETVLQIARRTGRDIMQIDIAGLRDKWVGESEKNIKAVFTQYKELCKQSEVLPILFFNEADGIINKRIENIHQSVDKMDNAMQNIILQEIENLEGILIATTNLTSNLDSAFERRFLFKIEFKKPEVEAKVKIWQSMMKNISYEDAFILASKYDFSGGQIENIARKRTIDYIMTGEYADLQTIEKYCNMELLNNSKVCKPVAGFGKKY